MATINLKDICKVYEGNVLAVKNVSLEIKDKEFMVLVGPSGCGKSTCLRMIAGLEDISSGTISIGDKVVNDIVPKDRDIAMVFQNYALYPHMTVYDNMSFALKIKRLPKAEIDRRVNEAAKILGLEEYLQRRPKQMSGGQRQRVAVGRAIVRDPKAFLFDEPLSNLDAKMRVQMRSEIIKLHQKLNSTMVYVTHDQTEAMTMGDRICVMKDGVIQQVDTPIEIYDHPANRFVASFIGTPPMNFIEGEINKVDGKLCFVSEGFKFTIPQDKLAKLESYEGKKIVFGIRPEDLGNKDAQGMADLSVLTAEVDIVEPMGSETYVYLQVGESNIISRVESHINVKFGEQCSFKVLPDKVHFFDFETENVI